jgi:hypothetical protein
MNSSGLGFPVLAREIDLGSHPVHDPARANVDDECGRFLLDRLGDLRRPRRAWPEIVLVEPNLEAGLLRLGRAFQAALERPRRLRIGTGMAQKNARFPSHQNIRLLLLSIIAL